MTDSPMNPYRKQAVDWLRNVADLEEGKPASGVESDLAGDLRVGRALRIAAQAIENLPEPEGVDNIENLPAPEPEPAVEATQSQAKPSGDLSQQIAAMSDSEMEQALAASVPPETAPNEDA